MFDEWPYWCPGCGAALLIDEPINVLTGWPQILARYGFRSVAMEGGWEKFGPRFQALTQESPQGLAASPLHNPFGRLKLVSMRDIAEGN